MTPPLLIQFKTERFRSFRQYPCNILFLPREHKIHIFSPPCDILYVIHALGFFTLLKLESLISPFSFNHLKLKFNTLCCFDCTFRLCQESGNEFLIIVIRYSFDYIVPSKPHGLRVFNHNNYNFLNCDWCINCCILL